MALNILHHTRRNLHLKVHSDHFQKGIHALHKGASFELLQFGFALLPPHRLLRIEYQSFVS